MRTRSTAILILPALLVLAGCRTYGGHGSEAATYATIERAVDWGAQERTRLSNDEGAFREATERMPFLEDFAPRLDALSASLTGAMSRWTATADGLEASSSYRDLSRALGAILSERQRYQDRYRRLVRDLGDALGAASPPPGEAHYTLVPAHYARIASRLDSMRIRDLLAEAE